MPPSLALRIIRSEFKVKVELSTEWSSALSHVVAIEKGSFGSPSTKVTNFICFTVANF